MPCSYRGKQKKVKKGKITTAKRKKLKVGQSKITYRKVGGKRRRVKVTKKSGKKYSVKVIGSKRKKKR